MHLRKVLTTVSQKPSAVKDDGMTSISVPLLGCGLSASYASVLTWLLNLVPDRFEFLWGEGDQPQIEQRQAIAPFHVLGLQQMVHDGQFALFVAVTPVEGASQVSLGKASKRAKVRAAQIQGQLQGSFE